MDWRVVFLTVLTWDFPAHVDSTFYLELINEKNLQGGELKMDLYACSFRDNSKKGPVVCIKSDSPQQRKKIYNAVNFWSVLGLQPLTGYPLEIGGRVVDDFLPQALAVGVDPQAYQNPNFKSVHQENEAYEQKIAQLKPHFVDSANKIIEQHLIQFFAVNNIEWFLSPTSPNPAPYFASYVVTLKRVIMASGFKGADLWHVVFGRKSSADNPTKRPLTDPQSPLRKDVMTVIRFLALKMFDPCLVFWNIDRTIGQLFCSTYCQFLAVAFDIYSGTDAGGCKDLNAGLCADKLCKCVRCGYREPSESVKMLSCNNALRQQWIQN